MDKMNLQSSQEHSDRYMLEQLIDVQKKELQIREKEAESRNAEIASNERIAIASIKAQSESDKTHAHVFNSAFKYRFWMIVIAITAITTFGITALICNQTDIALEVAKAVGFAVMGYFAGIGKAKIDQSNKKNDQGN